MQTDRITFPPESGHPEILLAHKGAPEALVGWLKGHFLAAVRAGHRFAPGQPVQIGWMMLDVRAEEDGRLALWEPDFSALPIAWMRGVDRTLQQHSVQQAVCDAIGAAPVFPELRDGSVVSAGFAEDPSRFLMLREAPRENSSGWQFKRLQETAKDGTRHSLYEVAVRSQAIVPFLALPPGALVARSPGAIEIELGERRLSSKTHELLAMLAAR